MRPSDTYKSHSHFAYCAEIAIGAVVMRRLRRRGKPLYPLAATSAQRETLAENSGVIACLAILLFITCLVRSLMESFLGNEITPRPVISKKN